MEIYCWKTTGCERGPPAIDTCRIVASVLDLEFASDWRNHCLISTGIIWHDLPQIATEAILGLLVLYPWRYPLWHVKSPKRSSGGKVLKSGNAPIAPFYHWFVYLVHLPLLYMQCVNPEMIFTARCFNENVMDMVWGVGKCRMLICILWAFCII